MKGARKRRPCSSLKKNGSFLHNFTSGIEVSYSKMLRSLFFSTMGVDIGQWRAAIGRFGGGRDDRTAVKRNLLQKLLLHDEEVVRMLLLLAGNERIPGPKIKRP